MKKEKNEQIESLERVQDEFKKLLNTIPLITLIVDFVILVISIAIGIIYPWYMGIIWWFLLTTLHVLIKVIFEKK